MRVLSCHISGFGKFVNRAFDLSMPVVVCKGENGWGKTTLADFIECMLYGLDGSRKASVSDNLRLKYEPWSGARYGGAMVIEEGGKTYRIERFFGKTPSADITRVFDGNNTACYDFGERGERIGETLLGVDRESYRRTAYVPQGEGNTQPLTGDIKSKLLAILSATPRDNGAQKAMERLDAAERALRAKRRPAKGKLDEIDEKLAYVNAQKEDCLRAANGLRAQRETLASYAQKIRQYTAELTQNAKLLEEYARRGELAANRAVRKELETTYRTAALALQDLQAFFGETDPNTLNTEGLEGGVNEYYALQKAIVEGERQLASLSDRTQEIQLLQTRLAACEKTLESYELLANAQQKKEKRDKKQAKTEGKYARKRRRRGMFVLFLSFCLAVGGAILTESLLGLGIGMLAVGAIGTLYGFAVVYRHTRTLPSSKRRKLTFDDPQLEERYNATRREADELIERLSALSTGEEGDHAALAQTLDGQRRRLEELEKAIQAFLANFRFEAVYDYRAALSRIKESVADYQKYHEAANAYSQKLSALAPADVGGGVVADYSPAEVEELRARQSRIEGERECLRTEYARLLAETDGLEARAAQRKDYEAEESRLGEEKSRLERRWQAIRTAKEILQTARANMATRYLDPVEGHCRRYAEILGFGNGKLRFNGEGLPVMEEDAALRAVDFYSAGLKDLLDFCVRIALAETIFTTCLPPLILDDPFANLDDEKTARAKALVQELSKKYQILYFTCKQERTL